MFSSGLRESENSSEVVLKDVSVKCFDRFLRYIYGDDSGIRFLRGHRVTPSPAHNQLFHQAELDEERNFSSSSSNSSHEHLEDQNHDGQAETTPLDNQSVSDMQIVSDASVDMQSAGTRLSNRDTRNMMDLFAIAHKYEVTSLMKDMQAVIRGALTSQNAAEFLHFAHTYQAKELEKAIAGFIMHTKEMHTKVRQTEYYKRLTAESLQTLLDCYVKD